MSKDNRQPSTSMAKLTIHGLDKMTRGERGEISRWLLRQAAFIKPMHREFAKRFTARFMVKDG